MSGVIFEDENDKTPKIESFNPGELGKFDLGSPRTVPMGFPGGPGGKIFRDKRVHVAIAIPPQSAITHFLNQLKELGGEFVLHDMIMMPPNPLDPRGQGQIIKVLVYLFEPETIKKITGDGYNSKTMYDISRFVKL